MASIWQDFSCIQQPLIASEVIDKARLRLADATDKSFDDEIMMEFLSDALQEFSSMTGCCQCIDQVAVGTEPLSFNSFNLTSSLDKDFLVLFAVYLNGTELDFVPRAQKVSFNIGTSGTAKGWGYWGNYLFLTKDCIMDDALEVFYTFVPIPVEKTIDILQIDQKYLTYLTAYVVYRAHEYNREGGQANRAYEEFINGIKAAAAIVEKQAQAGPFG